MYASNKYSVTIFAIVHKKTNELVYGFDNFDENDNQVDWFTLTSPLESEKYLSFETEETAWIFLNNHDLSHKDYSVVEITKRISFEAV